MSNNNNETPVCPQGEICQCSQMDIDPSYKIKYGKYSWDTEEDIGYHNVTLDNGIETKVWNGSDELKSKRYLQKIYDLTNFLKEKCEEFKNLDDSDYMYLIDSYVTKFEKKYKKNNVNYKDPVFIRNCFDLFTKTIHTFQELNPDDTHFQAVNKPKNVKFLLSNNKIGSDERLRSYNRHVVIKLNFPRKGNDEENYVMCLLLHELSHTPPNHVCFRVDDHKHDFRIFQALFLTIALKHGFITKKIFV